MRAILFDKSLHLKNIEMPIPNDDEALIQILTAGICNTDIEIIKGYMGFKGVLGHEFVGLVKQSKQNELIDKRVVGEINIGCNKCIYCINNLQKHCLNRKVIGIYNKNGTMSEYITLPTKNLHILPNTINNYEGIFVEPLAAACEILTQIHILPDYKIMILGDGKLATLIAQIINIVNPNLYVKGINPQKIKLLNNLSINADSKLFNKKEWDIIIEATGNPEGFKIALDYIKPRGIIILKSTYHKNIKINQNNIVVNEITVLGSRCGNFNMAINLLHNKLVDVKPLITKILPLENYKTAFRLAQNPNSYKIIFEINKK